LSFPVEGVGARRAERLWAVYNLERAADQATPPVSFAITTVGITYLATTLALLVTRGGAALPLGVELLLPLAPVGLFTSLTGLDQVSQRRGLYLDALEAELAGYDRADLRQELGDAIGNRVALPDMRRHSRQVIGHGVRRLLGLALHPYSLGAIFVVSYVVYVLDLRSGGWRQALASGAYVLLMLRNVKALLRSSRVRGARRDGEGHGRHWRASARSGGSRQPDCFRCWTGASCHVSGCAPGSLSHPFDTALRPVSQCGARGPVRARLGSRVGPEEVRFTAPVVVSVGRMSATGAAGGDGAATGLERAVSAGSSRCSPRLRCGPGGAAQVTVLRESVIPLRWFTEPHTPGVPGNRRAC